MENKSNNFDRQKYLKALELKGALKPCHRCESNSFSLLNGYSYYPIQDSWHGTIVSSSKIPAFLVVCNNCGAITPHALGAFEKIKDDQIEREVNHE